MILLQPTTTPIAANIKFSRLTLYFYFCIYLLNKLKTNIWKTIDTVTTGSYLFGVKFFDLFKRKFISLHARNIHQAHPMCDPRMCNIVPNVQHFLSNLCFAPCPFCATVKKNFNSKMTKMNGNGFSK